MRLNLLTEGTAASDLGDITRLKNALAEQLLIALERIGFRKPNMKPAESPTDDAIVYIEAGQNALTAESQTIMVTIEDDDRVRIQIPSDISRSGKKNLADILGIDDFFITGSAGEAIARLKDIKSKADQLIQNNGLRGSLSSGHIGEGVEERCQLSVEPIHGIVPDFKSKAAGDKGTSGYMCVGKKCKHRFEEGNYVGLENKYCPRCGLRYELPEIILR